MICLKKARDHILVSSSMLLSTVGTTMALPDEVDGLGRDTVLVLVLLLSRANTSHSFLLHSCLALSLMANAQNMKTPCVELRAMKMYHKMSFPTKAAMYPNIQVKPMRQEICWGQRSINAAD